MATYSYFLCGVIGRQFLDPEQGYKDHAIDLYFPVFTILQFIFYMGWLKVAESLLNPFGDDDDDFDINDLLERNMEVLFTKTLFTFIKPIRFPNMLSLI